jgi:hypothetical protein
MQSITTSGAEDHLPLARPCLSVSFRTACRVTPPLDGGGRDKPAGLQRPMGQEGDRDRPDDGGQEARNGLRPARSDNGRSSGATRPPLSLPAA